MAAVVAVVAALGFGSSPASTTLRQPGTGSPYGFGMATALDGSTLVATNPYDAVMTGSAEVFERAASGWTHRAKLEPPPGSMGSCFGFAAALQRDTVAVSAPCWDQTVTDRGFVSIFTRTGSAWTPTIITPPAHNHDQLFGVDVAIDGDVLAVGASGDDRAGLRAGAVYVYRRSAAGFTLDATLVGSAVRPWSLFGTSVAVSGNRLVVGAPGTGEHDDQPGEIYVFARAGDGWVEQARLSAPLPAVAGLGSAVAIDGSTIAAGAPYDSTRGVASGSVTLFEAATGGWIRRATLRAAGADAHAVLGSAVVVEGDVILAGAMGDDDVSPGSVHVFVRGESGWRRSMQLRATDARAGARYGRGLALDGGLAAIGAPLAGTGAVYLERVGCGFADPISHVLRAVQDVVPPGGTLGTVECTAGRALVGS